MACEFFCLYPSGTVFGTVFLAYQTRFSEIFTSADNSILQYSLWESSDFQLSCVNISFFHATKPPNSCGFCLELAGITLEFLCELREIFCA